MRSANRRELATWMIVFVIQASVVGLEFHFVPHTDSRALLGDLLHNASDLLLLFMTALPAAMIASYRMTNGSEFIVRARRLALVTNILALITGGVYSVIIGWQALSQPERQVLYAEAWPVAGASFVGNFVIYAVIRPFHHHRATRVFGWHQLWDVMSSLLTMVFLLTGMRWNNPQIDAQVCIAIGVGMIVHWPLSAYFERNGHHHH